ncbi:glycoside hydrolase family 16 protein [Hymenobacter terrigena]
MTLLSFSSTRIAPALAAVAVALAASSCTQNPPGPTITEAAAVAAEPVNATIMPYSSYRTLVWRDEFDGAALNSQKWAPEIKDVWYNNELQATTDSRNNLGVTNGNLVITAQREAYHGRSYTSARINTKGLRDFNFGRIDIRAKLPKGKGIWPAIWMLGSNDSQVSWPACGEIDIMELRGSTPQVNISTLHYGANTSTHQFSSLAYSLAGTPDLSAAYHTYTVIRGQDKTQFYVDSVQYYERTVAQVSPYPFNNPFYLILNVAVGGDFDGNPDGSTSFPQQMLVDYVRYYKYKE